MRVKNGASRNDISNCALEISDEGYAHLLKSNYYNQKPNTDLKCSINII